MNHFIEQTRSHIEHFHANKLAHVMAVSIVCIANFSAMLVIGSGLDSAFGGIVEEETGFLLESIRQ
jgi:hypothetical protein